MRYAVTSYCTRSFPLPFSVRLRAAFAPYLFRSKAAIRYRARVTWGDSRAIPLSGAYPDHSGLGSLHPLRDPNKTCKARPANLSAKLCGLTAFHSRYSANTHPRDHLWTTVEILLYSVKYQSTWKRCATRWACPRLGTRLTSYFKHGVIYRDPEQVSRANSVRVVDLNGYLDSI